MEYSEIFRTKRFSTVIEERINKRLNNFLLKEKGQEDLVFVLWTPSIGNMRYTAIINELIFPEKFDRNLHGNVSYNYQYLIRVCRMALLKNRGVALLHCHLGPGWQGMSSDDIETEKKTFINVFSTTNYPFVGLTLGTDGYWSSRIWYYTKSNHINKKWAEAVRICGLNYKVYFNDKIKPHVKTSNKNIRTINIWGEEPHKDISRLKVGIVGLGSVGSTVAEMLARMGLTDFVLIDFDTVEEHNLDRMCGVYSKDIGKLKVNVIKRNIKRSSTAEKIKVITKASSLVKEEAYRSALDCDVIFCCADKPRARYILNHIAFAHFIPVIDGGILIEFDNNRKLNFGDWTVHTITPGRPCLNCLNAYYSSDVELEQQGKLEDVRYMEGLPDNHHLKSRENVSPFSFNLASFEVLHFIVLVTNITEPEYYGEQKYRFKHGYLSRNYDIKCQPGCDFNNNIGIGDTIFKPYES